MVPVPARYDDELSPDETLVFVLSRGPGTRRGQQVWISVTVAALIPRTVFIAIPFASPIGPALRLMRTIRCLDL